MLENYISKYDKMCQQYRVVSGLQFGNEVANVLRIIREEKQIYNDYVSMRAIEAGNELKKVMENVGTNTKEVVVQYIKAELPLEYPQVCVWWYSVMFEINVDSALFKEFVSYVRKNRQYFSVNTQYFLFCQLHCRFFYYSKLDDICTKEEIWLFYKEIVETFAGKMSTSLKKIPYIERKNGKILVITEQLLGIQHGPTKIILDRCKVLIEKMGKSVFLLNTAESMSEVGKIAFMNGLHANYVQEWLRDKEREWKGTVIPYYQCAQDMPDLEEIDNLLSEIRKEAPEFVVSIGGNSILANLVNKMIPVLTVGLTHANLEYTTTDYQTLSRKLTEQERQLLRVLGYTENHIVEGTFTLSLRPQTEVITRKEMGVSEDSFLMVAVGARLDAEITEEFLAMLNEIIREDMQILFVGRFNNFEKKLRKFPKLYKYAVHVKWCDDTLAYMEKCDLYVNPIRKGGGTSCVEALFKGCPVVSVNYGDVAINAGEDFVVNDYLEMRDKIMEYYEDSEVYSIMSEKAQKRAEILLDSETEFVRIIKETETRIRRFQCL